MKDIDLNKMGSESSFDEWKKVVKDRATLCDIWGLLAGGLALWLFFFLVFYNLLITMIKREIETLVISSLIGIATSVLTCLFLGPRLKRSEVRKGCDLEEVKTEEPLYTPFHIAAIAGQGKG